MSILEWIRAKIEELKFWAGFSARVRALYPTIQDFDENRTTDAIPDLDRAEQIINDIHDEFSAN